MLRTSKCGRCSGTTWCGECYTIVKGRTSGPSAKTKRIKDEKRRRKMGKVVLRRENIHVAKGEIDLVDIDPEFERRHPTVCAFVTQDRFDDGGYRQTSTLLFFLDQGSLKVCLSDRQGSRSLFRSANSIEGCLDALEQALSDGTADWKAKRI